MNGCFFISLYNEWRKGKWICSKRCLVILALLSIGFHNTHAQTDSTATDSLSKFDAFNVKAEKFFKVCPVPIVTYSTEAGNTFGLAKFNAFHPVKSDTISKPSKLSGVATFSTKGRVNVSIANDLILKENKYMILSYFNFKKLPELMLGIGNDVSFDNEQAVTTNRIRFASICLIRLKENLYLGPGIDFANYFDVSYDSTSFLVTDNVAGKDGGYDVGVGGSLALDSRDNRYNAASGAFVLSTFTYYPEFMGSTYQFGKFDLDARKYYNPWLKHVVAVQATTTCIFGTVPFYDMAMMGGDERMRGYYKGAIRDKALVDGQIEYRLPIWKIFGIASWIATGRVAPSYEALSFEGFWLSYGGGVRIKVDSKSDINLRIDMGFGPGGVSGVYLNFAEAF